MREYFFFNFARPPISFLMVRPLPYLGSCGWHDCTNFADICTAYYKMFFGKQFWQSLACFVIGGIITVIFIKILEWQRDQITKSRGTNE